jgi:hypothetical protein
MCYNINTMSRTGFKWTVNEILSLQREFELLGWDIDKIALKHKRTPNAIMCKLDQEGFADYNVLYEHYKSFGQTLNTKTNSLSKQPLSKPCLTPTTNLSHNYDYSIEVDDSELDDDEDEDYVDDEDDDEDSENSEYVHEIAILSERVNNLEESVCEIRDLIKQLMSGQSTSKKSLYNTIF